MSLEFDFSQVAVPFRMQPGLQRLAPGARILTPLARAQDLFQEKRAVVSAGLARQCAPGFDPGPALAAIRARARLEGWPEAADGLPPELQFEEDFAVLDGADGRLPWLAVCVPSHWVPEQKCGLHFTALHAPVADSEALMAAAAPLVKLVTAGETWERHVWTISPSPRHDQHPHRQVRAAWPDLHAPLAFARQCHLRVERQCFFPVGQGTRQSVFTIRVMVAPLLDAAREPRSALRLADSLASMSAAVLDYKGLGPARERLVAALQSLAQDGADAA